jgi:hypothetical protein
MNENIVPSPHSQRMHPPPDLREKRAKAPWTNQTDPIIRFKDVELGWIAYPFYACAKVEHMETIDTVILTFAGGIQIYVKGSKALEFMEKFCAHLITGIYADGIDILLVHQVLQPQKPPAAKPQENLLDLKNSS